MRCLNGGRCELLPNGHPRCICTSNFEGPQCQFSSEEQPPQLKPACDPPCPADSYCNFDGICLCKRGSQGVPGQCKLTLDPCASNPCLHDGTCISQGAQVQCECLPAYTGQFCEGLVLEPQLDNVCRNIRCPTGSRCVSHGAIFSCVPDDRLEAHQDSPPQTQPVAIVSRRPNASRILDFSTRRPSLFLQTPAIPPINVSAAVVPSGLNQSNSAEILPQVSAEPPPGDSCLFLGCLNGGTCLGRLGHRCICPFGFSGQFCEEEISECSRQPCLNGGQCQAHPGGYQCICRQRWGGKHCEKVIKNLRNE